MTSSWATKDGVEVESRFGSVRGMVSLSRTALPSREDGDSEHRPTVDCPTPEEERTMRWLRALKFFVFAMVVAFPVVVYAQSCTNANPPQYCVQEQAPGTVIYSTPLS